MAYQSHLMLSNTALAKAKKEAERAKKVKDARAKMAAIRKAKIAMAPTGFYPSPSTSTTTAYSYSNTCTSSLTKISWTCTPGAGTFTPTPTGGYTLSDCEEEWYGGMMSRKLVPGVTYDLPDGAKLILDADGNYRVEDKDAVVTYKANRKRDFNPYINASDMLALFVRYASSLGVHKDDVLKLPIHLFISWLIIEAAQKDGISAPDDVIQVKDDPYLKLIKRPKCLDCGRFIPRLHLRNQFPYCSPAHATRRLQLN